MCRPLRHHPRLLHAGDAPDPSRDPSGASGRPNKVGCICFCVRARVWLCVCVHDIYLILLIHTQTDEIHTSVCAAVHLRASARLSLCVCMRLFVWPAHASASTLVRARACVDDSFVLKCTHRKYDAIARRHCDGGVCSCRLQVDLRELFSDMGPYIIDGSGKSPL